MSIALTTPAQNPRGTPRYTFIGTLQSRTPVYSVQACSRSATALPGRDERWGGMGGPWLGPPSRSIPFARHADVDRAGRVLERLASVHDPRVVEPQDVARLPRERVGPGVG